MLGIFENHVNALVLEDGFDEVDQGGVRKFAAKGHLADGGLRDAGVLDCFAFFVGLESGEGR